MKKILLFVLTFILMFSVVPFSVSAQASYPQILESDLKTLLYEFVENNPSRTIGTEGERKAGEYIAGKFFEFGLQSYFSDQAVNFEGDEQEEKVKYYNEITVKDFANSSVRTNNIVGYIPAKTATDDTVVIGAHLDNVYSVKINGEEIQSHGAYDNGTGIAVLLSLAKAFNGKSFDFNVVFVAFTGEENGLNGSNEFIVTMQSKKSKAFENLLLMFNLDVVGAGDYLYLYTDEVQTGHERFLLDVAKELNIEVKSPPIDKKLMMFSSYYDNLPYTHIGMMSDHARFHNQDKNVAFFFTFNWSSFSKDGAVESATQDAIMHTRNDNLKTLEEKYANSYLKYMSNTANVISLSLSKNSEFTAAMQDSYANKFNYDFWANPLWASLIGLGILLLFAGIIIFFYYKMKKKAPNRPQFERPIVPTSRGDGTVFGEEFEPIHKSDHDDPFGL